MNIDAFPRPNSSQIEQNNNLEDDWSDDEWSSTSHTTSKSIKGMELRNLIPKNQSTGTKSVTSNSSYSGYTIREEKRIDR